MGVLDGQVAIVAGESRGVGRGCAMELAAAGATVYVLGRTLHERSHDLPGGLTTTVREAAELGGTAIPVVCDLRSDASMASVFADVDRKHGHLDVLVNGKSVRPSRGMRT